MVCRDKMEEEKLVEEDEWLCGGSKLELDKFLMFHPGGSENIATYLGKDVRPAMVASQHSPHAYYLLRDIAAANQQEEGIVDWSKPMLGQVGKLGAKYRVWVWQPVDRPLRLFGSDLLESLTRTNWKQVLSVWVPVILVCVASSLYYAPQTQPTWLNVVKICTSLAVGMAVWPLIEYNIHRWLFHFQPPDTSSVLITLHFAFHGLHHKVPFDEERLLFPPGPACIMAVSIYYIYSHILPWWLALAAFSGTTLGYLIYDLIHYYLHHGNPKDNSYLYNMKRHHNQHHFSQQEKGFGISCTFWDHVFNTLGKLKKLSSPLRWNRPACAKKKL